MICAVGRRARCQSPAPGHWCSDSDGSAGDGAMALAASVEPARAASPGVAEPVTFLYTYGELVGLRCRRPGSPRAHATLQGAGCSRAHP